MYLDKENEFSDAQALTATAASTNYIDVGHTGNWGPGVEEIEVIVQVDVALTSGAGSTLVAALQTDDNTSFSSAASLATTGTIAKASLVAGYQVAHWRIPVSGAERYIRIYYTVGTADFTAGSISAFVVAGGQTNRNSF